MGYVSNDFNVQSPTDDGAEVEVVRARLGLRLDVAVQVEFESKGLEAKPVSHLIGFSG